MARTPNQIGSDGERRALAILGTRPFRGSGSGKWLKGDGKDAGGFVYFMKATTKFNQTWARAIKALWDEAVSGARGPAGGGDEAKPALIFELPDGTLLVAMKLEDHAAMATGEVAPYIAPTKAQERLARTRSTGMRKAG